VLSRKDYRRWLVGALLLVAPVAFAHYYISRPYTDTAPSVGNPVLGSATSTAPVLGAPTTTVQWACVNASGVLFGPLQSTQAAAETACGTVVAADGVTRFLEERSTVTRTSTVTTTTPTTTTTRTKRFELRGGTTLRVSDANAQFIVVSGGGGGAAGGGENTPETEVYTLEIMYPRQSGTTPDLATTNRAFFAYTGLTYEVPLVAVGGSYPYTWSLSNAPSGMTVEEYTPRAGLHPEYKIVWTNPTSNASSIVVNVEDAMANTDSQTYSITVGTSGWTFIDQCNDGSGDTGTIAAPFDNLGQLYTGSGANGRIYFRGTCTYTLGSLDALRQNVDHAQAEERVPWRSDAFGPGHGLIWLAYPGETPTIDFEYTGSGVPYDSGTAGHSVPYFDTNSANLYVAGFQIDNVGGGKGWRLNVRESDYGMMFWDNDFLSMGPGYGGTNAAFLLWSTDSPGSQGDIVLDNSFNDVQAPDHANEGGSMLKFYGVIKPVVAGNLFNNMPAGNGQHDVALAFKGGDLTQYTIRGNKFVDTHRAIGGNQAGTGGATGEINYNLVLSVEEWALEVADEKVTDLGRHDIYRNTFVGPVTVQNVITADGPYNFTHNVIINADEAQSPWPCIQENAVTDSSRVVIDKDLCDDAAAGHLDANGLLTGATRTTYLGARGFEIP
jgi:hypothetical protein